MPRQNPFDSDEEPPSLATAPAASSDMAYSNPFDDDNGDDDDEEDGSIGPPRAAGNTVIRTSEQPKLPPFSKSNPFDDDDDDDDDDEEQDGSKKLSKNGSIPAEAPGVSGFLMRKKLNKKKKNKNAISSSGKTLSIRRKAEMIKEAGMKHASKFVGGSLEQAQWIKESAYKAFESLEIRRKDQGTHRIDHQSSVEDSTTDQIFPQKDDKKLEKDYGDYLNHGRRGSNCNDSGRRNGGDELLESSSPSNGSQSNTSWAQYDEGRFQKQELEYRSLEELEGYAIQRSEDTTGVLQNCLKVAEEMRGDATKTLLALHSQGEQLRKTHEVAVEMDQNLKHGEKALGTLGGIFSRTWKPKKSPPLTGPVIAQNDPAKRRAHHIEQRVALGIGRSNPKDDTDTASISSSQQKSTTYEKLEMERVKQDDALADLSNVLDSLKGMSIDMGLEISSQVHSMDELEKDTIVLNDRVKAANQRSRHLLGR